MNDILRIIGILSGTSMDGISLGLFEFSANTAPKTIAHMTYPLPNDFKDKLLKMINSGECTFNEFGNTDRWIGELFAEAILHFIDKYTIQKNSIHAIGSHGQTIWHAPQAERAFTLQIGDPNIIAALTGIKTIADFRRADVAVGGQGAPLAPAFHHAVFANPPNARCIVNIGGFSNISVLENDRYVGFDPGPGNCLMDYWVQEKFQLEFDLDGNIASSGTTNDTLLHCMLDDPYFARKGPKSAGREYFNPQWLEDMLVSSGQQHESPINVLTTLLHLTSSCITTAIKSHAHPATQVFLCGGGAHNLALRALIGQQLEREVQTTAALGIDPDAVESGLFAWLAYQRILHNPIDLRAITGSKHPVLLGAEFLSAAV